MARLPKPPGVWVLALAPAIVLIALLAWGFIALESATGTNPIASATPSGGTPASAPGPTPDPAGATPSPTDPERVPLEMNIIETSTQVVCSGDITLYFRWSAPTATSVTFAVAGQEHLFDLPSTGNSMDDFPYPVEFPCPAEAETYRFLAISGDERAEAMVTVLSEP